MKNSPVVNVSASTVLGAIAQVAIIVEVVGKPVVASII